MLRARRLKLIADSNKPVFTSTETEWWLAEAPAKHEATPCHAPENSVKAPELKKENQSSSSFSAKDTVVDEPAPIHAHSTDDYVKEPAPQIATGFSKKEELTWDAKMSCFVMSY
jgi:hypothetical protein